MTAYTLQFDGLFEGVGPDKSATRAGFMGYGWLISKNGTMIARGHGVVARSHEATSSVAEYIAMIEGLEALVDLGVTDQPVCVMGDARSVIEQMQGRAAVNAASLKPLYRQALRLVRQFGQLQWDWLPRKNNREADALTRHALRVVLFDHSQYQAALKAIDPRRNGKRGSKKFLPLCDLRIYQPSL